MLHTKWKCRETRERVSETHNKKLRSLSEIQEKPLLNVNNTVKILEDNINIPTYVIETLSLGPKHVILDKFNAKDVLVELDLFLNHCQNKCVPEETINEINSKTLNYIKHCKQMKPTRNVVMTRKFLKDVRLVANKIIRVVNSQSD